ncbi:MAG: SMI1/KNR4 family protein [Anaerolineae bacterium]|nr:SMI1/KNR4 family protein [Anaerolineae bacterium]
MHDWKTFLDDLNKAVMASDDMSQIYIPEYARKMSWLGYPAATETQIAAVEAGLAIQLPPSYREFLLASNGWRKISPFIDELYRVEDIDWLRSHSPDSIRAWTEGYGEDFESESEEADLPRTLAVSGWGDSAIILLNPNVQDADGEWEAWFFANWSSPAAQKFTSFWELMQDQLEIQRDSNVRDFRQANPDAPDTTLAKRLPELIRQLELMKQANPNPFFSGINSDSYAAVVDEVVARIRSMPTDDSVELRKSLRELANELLEKSKGQQDYAMDLLKSMVKPELMAAGMGDIMKFQAYVMIASHIRTFLHES